MLGIIIASSLLMIPRGGDPSVQPNEIFSEGIEAVEQPCLFFGGNGVTAVTYAVWMRWTKRYGAAGAMDPSLQVSAQTSYQSARATLEGGPGITDYLQDAYQTAYLPLSSSGTWSASCLPGRSDLAPSTLPQWKYGCYVVNYKSDVGFTLVIGGAEKYCPASPTTEIFNICAETIDTHVSISADSPNAHINFGVGMNPLVQFIGSSHDNVNYPPLKGVGLS